MSVQRGLRLLVPARGLGGLRDWCGNSVVRGPVLLVEDSEIIALDTEDMLRAFDFDEVLVARSCAEAFDIIAAQRVECAVLDINLVGETSFPVARRLKSLGVPFVFATGYGARHSEADLQSAVIVPKPYTEKSLCRALAQVLGGHAGPGSSLIVQA